MNMGFLGVKSPEISRRERRKRCQVFWCYNFDFDRKNIVLENTNQETSFTDTSKESLGAWIR